MINIKTGESLYLSGQSISNNDKFRKKVWCLDQLANIITLDAIEDDKKRKEIIAKSNKDDYMFPGAVAGGVIDSLMGDGDTIIDGVLAGALFGSLISSESNPESPKAIIVLLFKDNITLPLEVDVDEYTKLQTIAIDQIANANENTAPQRPSLQLWEKQLIKQSTNHSNKMILLLASISVFAITMALIGPTNFFTFIGLELPLPVEHYQKNGAPLMPSSEEMAHFAFMFFGFTYYVLCFAMAIGPLNYYMQRYKNWNESFYYSDEFTKVDQFGHLEILDPEAPSGIYEGESA